MKKQDLTVALFQYQRICDSFTVFFFLRVESNMHVESLPEVFWVQGCQLASCNPKSEQRCEQGMIGSTFTSSSEKVPCNRFSAGIKSYLVSTRPSQLGNQPRSASANGFCYGPAGFGSAGSGSTVAAFRSRRMASRRFDTGSLIRTMSTLCAVGLLAALGEGQVPMLISSMLVSSCTPLSLAEQV